MFLENKNKFTSSLKQFIYFTASKEVPAQASNEVILNTEKADKPDELRDQVEQFTGEEVKKTEKAAANNLVTLGQTLQNSGLAPDKIKNFVKQSVAKLKAAKKEQAEGLAAVQQEANAATDRVGQKLDADLGKVVIDSSSDQPAVEQSQMQEVTTKNSAVVEQPTEQESLEKPTPSFEPIARIVGKGDWISKIVQREVSTASENADKIRTALAVQYGLDQFPTAKIDSSGQEFVKQLFAKNSPNAAIQKINKTIIHIGDEVTIDSDGSLRITHAKDRVDNPASAVEDSNSQSVESQQSAEDKVASEDKQPDSSQSEVELSAEDKAEDKQDAEHKDEQPQSINAKPKESSVYDRQAILETLIDPELQNLGKDLLAACPELEISSLKVEFNAAGNDNSNIDARVSLLYTIRGQVFRTEGDANNPTTIEAKKTAMQTLLDDVKTQYNEKIKEDQDKDYKTLEPYPEILQLIQNNKLPYAHNFTINFKEEINDQIPSATITLTMDVRGNKVTMEGNSNEANKNIVDGGLLLDARNYAVRDLVQKLAPYSDLDLNTVDPELKAKALQAQLESPYLKAVQNPISTIPSQIPEQPEFDPETLFKESIKSNLDGSVDYVIVNPDTKEQFAGRLQDGNLILKKGYTEIKMPLGYYQGPNGRHSKMDSGNFYVAGKSKNTLVPEGDCWVDANGDIGLTPETLQALSLAALRGEKRTYKVSNEKIPTTSRKLRGSMLILLGESK